MTSSSYTVTVHPFVSQTPFSCAYERGNPSSRNALVYLGGLTTGPHTTPQLNCLIETLNTVPELSYSFWEFRMRSSYTGFGYSSLANDAEDIAALVTYLRALNKTKIVLLGSSTGMLFPLFSPYDTYAYKYKDVKISLTTPSFNPGPCPLTHTSYKHPPLIAKQLRCSCPKTS